MGVFISHTNAVLALAVGTSSSLSERCSWTTCWPCCTLDIACWDIFDWMLFGSGCFIADKKCTRWANISKRCIAARILAVFLYVLSNFASNNAVFLLFAIFHGLLLRRIEQGRLNVIALSADGIALLYVGVGLACGCLALWQEKVIVILATASVGAFFFCVG